MRCFKAIVQHVARIFSRCERALLERGCRFSLVNWIVPFARALCVALVRTNMGLTWGPWTGPHFGPGPWAPVMDPVYLIWVVVAFKEGCTHPSQGLS